MMAPAMTAPPMTPAAIPGPNPHPRPRHWAETSVVVAATVTRIVAAPSKLTMVFFINVSFLEAGDAEFANRDRTSVPLHEAAVTNHNERSARNDGRSMRCHAEPQTTTRAPSRIHGVQHRLKSLGRSCRYRFSRFLP